MRKYTQQTIKQLFALSGNVCALPNCDNVIVNTNGTIIGEICHINALNQQGPRFNSELDPNVLNTFENLILLCPTCHTTVDKEYHIYTVEKLKNIKRSQSEKFEQHRYKFDFEKIDHQISNLPIVQHIKIYHEIEYNVYAETLIKLSQSQSDNERLKKELISWVKKYKTISDILNKVSTDEYSIQGEREFKKGDFSTSEEQYLLSIKNSEKELAKRYFILAVINELQLKYDNAFNYYKKALDLEPSNLIYLKEFAYSAYNKNDFETAFDYLEKILISFKDTAERDNFMVNIKEFLEEKLEDALNNDNDLEIAILSADLGSIYFFLKDLDKAKEYLSKSFEIYEDNFPTLIRKNHVEMILQIIANSNEQQIINMVDQMLNNLNEILDYKD